VLEDFLDSWPGVVVTVTHDRYFLERVSDMVYAIRGDGHVRHLPRGVDQYIDELTGEAPRRPTSAVPAEAVEAVEEPVVDAAAARAAKKELNRIERQLATPSCASWPRNGPNWKPPGSTRPNAPNEIHPLS
jgi:ATP-binding cassette subfamily F protein uup